MTVLVTGASGFIGTRLVARLTAAGFAVRGTFRKGPPEIPGVQWWALENLESPGALVDAVAGAEAIVHLAGLAHQLSGAGRGAQFMRVNAEGTRLLARAAVHAGVRRFIFMSSVAVIGRRTPDPLDDRSACTPEDDYGRSKLQAEQALMAELQDSCVDWCILRPPLVYGPAAPGNMGRLLRLLARGLPLPLGAIRNRRSFIFVDNLVDAILAVLRYPNQIRSSYVLSDGSDFSTPELVRALASAAGLKVRLVHWPVGLLRLAGRAGDLAVALRGAASGWDSYSVERLTGSLVVDGSRFRDDFDWRPPVARDRALQMTCGEQRHDI